jgi:phosphatidylinositol dimannoside acyltransferase
MSVVATSDGVPLRPLKEGMVEVARDVRRWWYWYPWRRLVQALPHPARVQVARLLGTLFYLSSPSWRALTQEELRASFQGRPASHSLARLSLWAAQQYYLGQLEVFTYPRLTPRDMEAYFPLEGQEYLDAAQETGRGVMVLLSHLGANQMIMPALGFRGYRVNQISRAAKAENDEYQGRHLSPLFRKIINLQRAYEESLPARHIDVSRGLRQVFRKLKANELVALAGDGRYGIEWTPHTFLGRPATFSPGPWLIAHRTGALLLPIFVLRPQSGCRYRVIIESPLSLPYGADSETFLQAGLDAYVHRLETYFYRYPWQYAPFLYLARRYTRNRVNQFFQDYPADSPAAGPPVAQCTGKS